jgi:hypothetical protein
MTGAAAVDFEFALPHIAQAAELSVATENFRIDCIPFALYAHF